MRWKLYLSLLLQTLVLIFVMQNTETVVFNFLFWNFGVPRALLLLVVFVAGITTGLLLVASKRSQRSKGVGKKSVKITTTENITGKGNFDGNIKG